MLAVCLCGLMMTLTSLTMMAKTKVTWRQHRGQRWLLHACQNYALLDTMPCCASTLLVRTATRLPSIPPLCPLAFNCLRPTELPACVRRCPARGRSKCFTRNHCNLHSDTKDPHQPNLGPPGLHTTARQVQTRTFEGPGA